MPAYLRELVLAMPTRAQEMVRSFRCVRETLANLSHGSYMYERRRVRLESGLEPTDGT